MTNNEKSLLEGNESVTRNTWSLTVGQEQFLSDNWHILDDLALGEMLGTTREGAKKLRQRRGFNRRGRRASKTPKDEVPIILWVLRGNYEDLDKAKTEIRLKLGEIDEESS